MDQAGAQNRVRMGERAGEAAFSGEEKKVCPLIIAQMGYYKSVNPDINDVPEQMARPIQAVQPPD